MAAPTFYVETSVWGSLGQRQPLDRKNLVYQLLRLLNGERGICVTSRVVLDEVGVAPSEDAAVIHTWLDLTKAVIVRVQRPMEELAKAYIAAGVLPSRREVDALHIAIATCSEIDYVVSWNHRHMTSAAKRRAYEAINRQRGYEKTPHICKPSEAIKVLRKA